jgi:hypothetical protein
LCGRGADCQSCLSPTNRYRPFCSWHIPHVTAGAPSLVPWCLWRQVCNRCRLVLIAGFVLVIKASVVRLSVFYPHSISIYYVFSILSTYLLYCLYIFCNPQWNERADEQHGRMLRRRARFIALEIWACSARTRARALLCAGKSLAGHSFVVDIPLIEAEGGGGCREQQMGEGTGPSL